MWWHTFRFGVLDKASQGHQGGCWVLIPTVWTWHHIILHDKAPNGTSQNTKQSVGGWQCTA